MHENYIFIKMKLACSSKWTIHMILRYMGTISCFMPFIIARGIIFSSADFEENVEALS